MEFKFVFVVLALFALLPPIKGKLFYTKYKKKNIELTN